MCATCGCGDLTNEHSHPHDHAHDHDHPHPHQPMSHQKPGMRMVKLEQDVLAKNDSVAQKNRAWLASRSITAFNLVSSPGSGKTTLLEKTLSRLSGKIPLAAIEGDQETDRDAERLRAIGCPVVQINTGAVCHLDAEMVSQGMDQLDPSRGSLLFIENVGNLVCPAMFDLGERAKVVVASVTEGEDKPLKYPHMFKAASVLVLNKIDLLPHLSFNVNDFIAHAHRVNPHLQVFQLSATRGDGLDAWCDWLVQRATEARGAAR